MHKPTPTQSAVAGAISLALTGNFTIAAETRVLQENNKPAEAVDEVVVEVAPYRSQSRSDKFTASLLDTPKSVAVIPLSLVQEQGGSSLVEALRNVPGITFNAGEGGQPAGDNLKIRGFDAGADVFIDGVRDAGSQSRDVFALEQIEVSKGPGSVYSGRGSTGGTVNLVTKKPQAETFLQTSVGGGSDAYLRGTVDANFALNDSIAMRLNGLGHTSDVAGRDSVAIDHRGAASSLAFGLGTATRVGLDYYYYRTDDMPDYSIPYGRNADNTSAEGPPVAVDRNTFYGLVNRDFQKTGADVGTLDIEHDLSDTVKIRNRTRYGDTFNNYIVTNPDDSRANVANGFVLRSPKSRNSLTRTKANLTDISAGFATARIEHSLVAGIELGSERMYNRNYTVATAYSANANGDMENSCSVSGAAGAVSNYNCTTLDNPNPRDPWSGVIEASSSATIAETDTRSAYVLDTMSLSERWSVNLGLRHDVYSTRQQSGPIAAPVLTENKTDFWNHQLGLVYKPAADGSVYIVVGTSSNPSGNTLGDGTENIGSNNADLEPERNRNLEIGTKWDLFDGDLALTSALFRTEKTNARVSVEPGRGGRQETVGEQRVDGFEIGVSGRLSRDWQLHASYTWLDSEIVDDGPVSGNDGNDFPNTPRHSFNLWTTRAVTDRLAVGAGATYVDRRYGNPANTVWVPPYIKYDAMVQFAASDRVNLQLNLFNLSDTVYFLRPYANHYAAIGPARSVVLTASLEF